MKEVGFGFSNDIRPSGSFEGIGLGTTSGPVKGEHLGFIELDGTNYIIARTTMSFRDEGIGKIVVREALADLYPDGSAILFLNQYVSDRCLRLEEHFNSPKTIELLAKGIPVKELSPGFRSSLAYECASRGEHFSATAIKKEVFEQKKELLRKCTMSFSEMRRQLEESYKLGSQEYENQTSKSM